MKKQYEKITIVFIIFLIKNCKLKKNRHKKWSGRRYTKCNKK